MPNQTSGSQSQGQASNQSVVSGYTSGMMTGGGQQSGQQAGQTAGAQQGEQAVIGVFDERRQAEQAINALRQQGFTNEEISIVAKKGDKEGKGGGYVEDDVTDGALTGGTLGGIGGLILGAGALAIPGIGPIVAAGPIAAALGGAVAGGVAGGLIDWGIPADVSRRYEQEVAQGGVLAVINTTGQKVNQAAQILRQNGAKNVESHSTQSRQKGS
jgi:rhodanese-related sulfurtransferase